MWTYGNFPKLDHVLSRKFSSVNLDIFCACEPEAETTFEFLQNLHACFGKRKKGSQEKKLVLCGCHYRPSLQNNSENMIIKILNSSSVD